MRPRQEQIEERQEGIPKMYRGIYERAMNGKSRKAAMHAFCLECCCWQIKEVHQCSDCGCPLYPYKPRTRLISGHSQACRNDAELTNSAKR